MGLDALLENQYGHWSKFRSFTYTSFYPVPERFPRYEPIFKVAIFGHETWPMAKVPEVAHILTRSFYHRGSKLSLFSHYGQQFARYKPIF